MATTRPGTTGTVPVQTPPKSTRIEFTPYVQKLGFRTLIATGIILLIGMGPYLTRMPFLFRVVGNMEWGIWHAIICRFALVWVVVIYTRLLLKNQG